MPTGTPTPKRRTTQRSAPERRTPQRATNGWTAPVTKPEAGADPRRAKGGIQGLIAKRVASATDHALDGPNQTLMRAQGPMWEALCKYYFRLEVSGWDRLPAETSLLIGNHSGASLTMDAWTFVYAWWRRFGADRVLHGTAHDVLMAAPGPG